MVKQVLVVLLAFLLAGCASTSVDGIAYSADPTEMVFRATELAMSAEATSSALRVAEARASAAAESAAQTADAYRWQATQAAIQMTQVVEATQAAIAAEATARAWSVQETQISWTQSAIDVLRTQDASQQQALATSNAVQAGIAQQALIREQTKTDMITATKMVWPWMLLVIAGGLALAVAYGMIQSSQLRVIQRGADGKSPVILAKGKIVAPDVVLRPVTDVKKPELADVGVQMRITENSQKVDAIRALAAGGKGASANKIAGGMSEPAAESAPVEVLPTQAVPWAALESWHGGNSLPLGVGSGKQGIVMSLDKTPHLMIAGTSGAGKTMCGLRPLAAMGLVSGAQVIVMNDAGGDFEPLKHINLTRVEGEEEIASALESLVREVERRSDVMSEAGETTWTRMPNWQTQGPRIMVMIDELVALANRSNNATAARIWKAVIYLTSKGRKFGIHVIVATTDPTYRTLGRQGLIVRDNCGRMVLRVRDASSSRAALDVEGAETLGEHQFIAQLAGGVQKGVAFHPTDDELRNMLASREVPQLPGLHIEHPSPGTSIEEQVRALYSHGLTMNAIQREVFGFTGGSAYTRVRDILGSTTGSTTGEDAEIIESEE